jgi:hypothetical protein
MATGNNGWRSERQFDLARFDLARFDLASPNHPATLAWRFPVRHRPDLTPGRRDERCRTPANGQDGLETVTGMAMDVLADTPSPKRKYDDKVMCAIVGPYARGLDCTAKFLALYHQCCR